MSKLTKHITTIIAMVVLAIGMTLGLTSCKKNDTEVEKVVRFVGVSDTISLQQTVTEYDFCEDVFCYDEEDNALEYNVDSSQVQYGVVGEYKVFYEYEATKQEAIVRIYGMPEFIYEEYITVSYTDAMNNVGLSDKITCKDSFGVELEVQTAEFVKTNGVVAVGENKILVTAADVAGNVAEKEISVIVENPTVQAKEIEDQTVDFANATLSIEVDNYVLSAVYFNGEILSEQYYLFNEGKIVFFPEFFRTVGEIENKSVGIVYEECYSSFNLTVTNSENANVIIENDLSNDAAFFQGSRIELPILTIGEYSIQNLEIITFITKGAGDREMLFETSYLLSEDEASYKLEMEIYKDGELERIIERNFYSSTEKAIEGLDFANESARVYFNIQDEANSGNSLVFGQEVTKGGVTKTALMFYTPTNFGVNTNDNIMGDYYHLANISLKADIIAAAKAAGYISLTFSLASGNTPVVESGSVSNRVFVHNFKGTGTVNGGEGYLFRGLKADESWATYTVNLNDLTNGTVAFACGGDTLYIADLAFDKPIDLDADLTTFKDAWNSYDGTITLGESVTKGDTTKTALKFYTSTNKGQNTNDNVAGDYYHLSNISLKSSIISEAIEKGYVAIKFKFATEATPASGTVSQRFFVHNYKGTSTVNGAEGFLYRALNASAGWEEQTISLHALTLGTISFAAAGDTVYLAEVYFVKGTDLTKDMTTIAEVWNSYDGTITLGESVTKGETTKSALKFYTDTNKGQNTNDNVAGDYYHLSNISLKSSVIVEAINAGYTTLTVTIASENTPIVDTGSVANRVFVHDYKGTSTVNGAEGFLFRGLKADTQWQTFTINLSDLTKGTVAFACGGDTLYITEVYFSK